MALKICNYYVTLRCNDTCEFCSIWQKDEYSKVEERPYDLMALKRAGVGQLNITGGEPLLRGDLPEILKQAKDLGFVVCLMTNGILYPDKARQLYGLVNRLYFSLDYPMAEAHDRSRGVECFHQVVRSIELAREMKQNPIIKFTMTRDSVLY
jgi:MoaA/NifB/PqqE/SkfB family radical SAM enzyme